MKFNTLSSLKDIFFPQAETLEGITTPQTSDDYPHRNFNPKRMITFHGRMIKFYECAIEDAKVIAEDDYVAWLEHRLEKERKMHLRRVRMVQEQSFQNTIERIKTN
jgi:hypothetical protein